MADLVSAAGDFVRSHPSLEAPTRKVVGAWQSLGIEHRLLRKRFAMQYYAPKLKQIEAWAPLWTENDNFYYDLTPRNRFDLAALIAVVTGETVPVIDHYLGEITTDAALRDHIAREFADDPALRDARVAFGRRIGWYAFVRALKPRVVVETGVHHGIGACVLTSALIRNAAEGQPGQYLGTDIDPGAGRLLTGQYAEHGRVLYGDSLESLTALTEDVDLFINDSDHSAEYEAREYVAILPRLSSRSVILGDNSHVSDSLREFARTHERPYLFFREEPLDHWYPGAGIGISPSGIPVGSAG